MPTSYVVGFAAKRRARDSNPQPLAGHHISSVAAHHSHTLPRALFPESLCMCSRAILAADDSWRQGDARLEAGDSKGGRQKSRPDRVIAFPPRSSAGSLLEPRGYYMPGPAGAAGAFGRFTDRSTRAAASGLFFPAATFPADPSGSSGRRGVKSRIGTAGDLGREIGLCANPSASAVFLGDFRGKRGSLELSGEGAGNARSIWEQAVSWSRHGSRPKPTSTRRGA
jgi:hypothetical protein